MSNRICADAALLVLVNLLVPVDEAIREFRERHNGGTPGCGCRWCEGPYSEDVDETLSVLSYMLNHVACVIGSCIRRRPDGPSEN